MDVESSVIDLPLLSLSDDNGSETRMRSTVPTIVEFWNTRCTQCPAVLEMLDDMTTTHPNVDFMACALATAPDDTPRLVKSLVDDGFCSNLRHTFASFPVKEKLKLRLGFARLPFAICINKDGVVTKKGAFRAEWLQQEDAVEGG